MPVYAPGTDATPRGDAVSTYRPRNGAGGIHASYLPGSTPKYAVNAGRREVQERNTQARMFIRVDRDEYDLFRASIGDDQVRERLVDRLAGDPTNPRRVGETIIDTGYMDFQLTDVQMGFQEKFQVSQTLADNYVAYFFGQDAPLWTYSGILLNTVQDDQHSNFVRLYLHVLRGTKLAQRQKIVSLRYDSFVVAGALTNFQSRLASQGPGGERALQFSFQYLVKRLYITNYTAGWVPTRPAGRFAADPLAVAYDGRPRAESAVRAMVVTAPPDAEEGPAGYETEDPRNHLTNPADAGQGPDPYIRDGAGNAVGQNPAVATPAVIRTSPQPRDPAAAAATAGRPHLSDLAQARTNVRGSAP